jgi:hypothetical protein
LGSTALDSRLFTPDRAPFAPEFFPELRRRKKFFRAGDRFPSEVCVEARQFFSQEIFFLFAERTALLILLLEQSH